MDIHAEALLAEYRNNLPTYNKLSEVVSKMLRDIVVQLKMLVNSVDTRVKTEKSLAGKLELKGDKYKQITDITDLVGCRVVTFYSNEVDLLAAKIATTFDIDWDNSVDKRKIHKVDQFGYMSLHYICKLPKKLYSDEKFPYINDVPFEIQLRTVLQHTWATIYHDTGYKNDVEVPSEYLRSLNRLAGLLEIADQEFTSIKTSLNEYRKRILELVKSGHLEDVELNGDSYSLYANSGSFEKLNKRIASINNMDIEEVSTRKLLPVFKYLGMQTAKDLDDCFKNYADQAYKFCILQFEDTDIDIISSMTGPTTIIFVIGLNQGLREDGIEKLLELIYGKRRSNASFAKKIISIGKTMGICKE